MPSTNPPQPHKTLQQLVEEMDRYPIEAFLFVQEGLKFAVDRTHGPANETPSIRHISGQELSEGLREFSLQRWGRLSRTVLRQWGISSTFDFGRIVFGMIANGMMQKTEEDSIEDFKDVYDFKAAFEADYRIPSELTQKTRIEGRP